MIQHMHASATWMCTCKCAPMRCVCIWVHFWNHSGSCKTCWKQGSYFQFFLFKFSLLKWHFFLICMKNLPVCLNGERFVHLSLHGDGGQEEEHPQLLVETHLLLSLNCWDHGVSQTPEQAQGHLVAGLPAVCKDRMKGPNGAYCILGGMLNGLGARKSALWGDRE